MAMKRKTSFYDDKKPYKKRKTSYRNTNVSPATVAAIQRVVARNTEMKYYDCATTGTPAISSASAWTGSELDPATRDCLFCPVLGSDINQRIGRKCLVNSIKMNFTVTFPAVAAGATGRAAANIRLICYQDKQANGTQSQGEDLMATTATNAVGTAETFFMNVAQLGRFNVLWDKRFVLQDPNFSGTGTADTYDANGRTIVLKMRHKFKEPVVVNFTAVATETVTAIVDNTFHLIGITNNTALAPTIGYTCRVGYKDA